MNNFFAFRFTTLVAFFVMTAEVVSAQSAPIISYLIPDIGTPDFNTYIEIIGPCNQNGNFGGDGIYLNNPGDTVQVSCANPADTNFITIGPCVVSWNGKMIATQVFVHPGLQPNSSDWQQLNQQWRIPIHVIANGKNSNSDTFYIVQPQPAIIAPSPGAIGSGGAWGVRSRRGAMIIDSMNLSGGTFTIDTADCDPGTPGNQGYLPAVILSKGAIIINPGATLSADADSDQAGPGGGGGGGVYDDGMAGIETPGGDGYSGGQGGTRNGGSGSGVPGNFITFGGHSLNGMAGGSEVAGSLSSSGGQQGTGGGSGFPFGSSGLGGYNVKCKFDNSIGGYSGGSGADECDGYMGVTGPDPGTAFGGGGGGNATAGTATTSGGGFPSGNDMIVPLSGGSGGSGGNPWQGVAGEGGGGGGALSLYCIRSLNYSVVNANGANGGNMDEQISFDDYSGAGGGGSGGGIMIMSKIALAGDSLQANGGTGGIATVVVPGGGAPVQNGGSGGTGRVRMDGPLTSTPHITPSLSSQYRGPSTDTSHYVMPTFLLTGTGNGQPVNIYIKPGNGLWRLYATESNYANNNWSQNIALGATDTIYYLAAAQQISAPDTAQFTMEPSWVLSQAAANILRGIGRLIIANVGNFKELFCDSVTYSNVEIRNTGSDTLRIDSLVFTPGNEGFSIVPSPTLPLFLPPGTDTSLTIQFAPQIPGTMNVILEVVSNATNTPALTFSLMGQKDTIGQIITSISMSADSGKPGDTVYLPVIVNSLNQTPLSRLSYQLRVSYNPTILLPVGVVGGKVYTVGNGFADFTVNNAADTAYLVCIVGLGDSTETRLNVDSAAWADIIDSGGCSAQSILNAGIFTLTGLCQQGRTRLFVADSGIMLSQNEPNPFNNATTIQYRTIENGETRLWVADVLGRTLAVLADGNCNAGIYTLNFQANNLHSGVYYYILQTPSQRLAREMFVIK